MFSKIFLNQNSAAVLERMLQALKFTKNIQLAEYLGVTPQSVAKAGKVKIPEEWVEKVCNATDVSPIWLLTGDGAMYSPQEKPEKSSVGATLKKIVETVCMIMIMPTMMPSEPLKNELISKSILLKKQLSKVDKSEDDFYSHLSNIPLIEWRNVISWCEEKKTGKRNYTEGIFVGEKLPYGSFALIVENEVMIPEFSEGEIIVVTPTTNVDTGNFVVAEINETATLRRCIKDAGHIYLSPLNKDYIKLDTKNDAFRILGKVVQKIKKY